MGRGPCCSKEGMNKGAWTAIEDELLVEYIKVHGEGKWSGIPKKAGNCNKYIEQKMYQRNEEKGFREEELN